MTTIRMNGKSKPTSIIGKLFQTIFGLIFAGVGFTFLTFMIGSSTDSVDSTKWPTANAVVTHGKIVYPQGSNDDYQYDLKYQFTYKNKKYSATKISNDRSSSDLLKVQGYELKYPVGKMTKCYINMVDPAKSVLEAGNGKNNTLIFFMIIPIIFISVGLFTTISVWRAPKKTVSKSAIKSSKKTPLKDKIGVCLFLGIFATVGTCIFYFLCVKTLIKLNDAESWSKVPCEIVNSRVKSHSDSDGTTYSIDILYKYNYNGQNWTCNEYSFNSGNSSGYDGKNVVVRQYPKGKTTQCYVNPQKPYEAVISREGGNSIIIGAIFGLVFGIIGYGGIFVTLFGKDKRKCKKSIKKSEYQRNIASSEIDNYNSQWEVDSQQNVELKPTASRLTKLITIIFVCLFWNGITWTIALEIIKKGDIGPMLFISIFILVGLAIVGAVIHQFLALSNAKAKITISSDAVRIGEIFAIKWTISEKVERICNLKVTFVGIESATYQRGTNTHTDNNEFYTEHLVETTDHNEMRSGHAIVELPTTTMHSFNSGNNKITWQLKVHGDIKFWPDIKDDYEIEILPLGRN